MNKKHSSTCYFSTGICDSLTCCKDNKWTEYGYPINQCRYYPCAKYKKYVTQIDKRTEGELNE